MSRASKWEENTRFFIRLCSRVIVQFLTVLMKQGYTGEFESPDGYSWENYELHRQMKQVECGQPQIWCATQRSKNAKIICIHPISLVSLYWQLQLASWSTKKQHKKITKDALAGVAQLFGRCPVHWKVAGSTPGQAICSGFRLDPSEGGVEEAANLCFAPTMMFLFFPPSLSKSEILKKTKDRKSWDSFYRNIINT